MLWFYKTVGLESDIEPIHELILIVTPPSLNIWHAPLKEPKWQKTEGSALFEINESDVECKYG